MILALLKQNFVSTKRCIGFDLDALKRINLSAIPSATQTESVENEQKTDYKNVVVKLEKKVEELNIANMYLNKRIGTDIINDSDETDSALSDDEETNNIIINTRHEEYDTGFASLYPFKTNVIHNSIDRW